MRRIVLHAEGFSIAFGVLEGNWDKIFMRIDGRIITERERKVVRGVVDWAPQVDDLEALRKKAVDILSGQVTMDARSCRGWRLVNVHALHRLALVRGVLSLHGVVASNGCKILSM